MEFSAKIKILRQQKGLNQKQLAEALKLSLRTISAYESGKNRPRTRETYQQIADFFGIEVGQLLADTPLRPATALPDLVQEVSSLFERADLDQAQKDAIMQAIQTAYWQHK